MYKMIGGDSVEYGPVTAEQLKEWIAEHRANRHTLVQEVGTTNWVPLGQMSEFADALTAAEMAWQDTTRSLAEHDSDKTETSVQTTRKAEFRVTDCLGDAWSLMTRHPSLTIGGATLAWLIVTVLTFGTCVGGLLRIMISGPLYGGLAILYLKLIREEKTSLKELFAGFMGPFGQLMIVWLVARLVSDAGLALCILPGVFLKVIWVFGLALVADKGMPFWPALELSRQTVMANLPRIVTLLVLAYLPMVVFETYTIYRIGEYVIENFGNSTLAYDSEEFREKLKQLLGFAATLGFQEHFVLLLNLPFATASVLYAYERFFGRTKDRTC
ncbi:MAG: DUF4339 domain-containing protein [Verrucomicrobiae bacterium]|nr:DUF4339 domain-containing protein [Verrucomicrobiae bacterium]